MTMGHVSWALARRYSRGEVKGGPTSQSGRAHTTISTTHLEFCSRDDILTLRHDDGTLRQRIDRTSQLRYLPTLFRTLSGSSPPRLPWRCNVRDATAVR